jgi:hypothetical protein
VQPDAAGELGERKARHLLETGAEAIAAANPDAPLSSISICAGSGARWSSTTRSSCWRARSVQPDRSRERPRRATAGR